MVTLNCNKEQVRVQNLKLGNYKIDEIIFDQSPKSHTINYEGKTRNLVEYYKDELENCIAKEDIELGEKLMAEIEYKEKLLKKLKNKNTILIQTYNQAYYINSKIVTFQQNEKKLKKGEGAKSSFADFKYFQTVNYNFQIK